MAITIIAVQAVPVPQGILVEYTSELLAKHRERRDDFDLAEAEADPRKREEEGREKRSPVAPLVELTSELLAKHPQNEGQRSVDSAVLDSVVEEPASSFSTRDKRSPYKIPEDILIKRKFIDSVGPVLARNDEEASIRDKKIY